MREPCAFCGGTKRVEINVPGSHVVWFCDDCRTRTIEEVDGRGRD